ncbi:AI-2E family transporter [Enterococcus rivorum]|uniref:AI-2E family transporter n=1 Tax=Enterococcus rivorum TaxID=762845 RepID=A0A1E5KXN9_9ENTE|nr:AI-2E family transporter [Enterococcus rivorum]MBP2099897.1 putative PurR-regulated permease PerM [Enterococcus rivorum]OEH82568.1 AI-2E family transporter [Enterococcus rivorum]
MGNKNIEKMIMKYLIIVTVLVLSVLNASSILKVIAIVLGAFSNIFLAMLVAYVVNIIMVKIEEYLSRRETKIMTKVKRPVSLLLSLFVVIIIICLLIMLVVPATLDSLNMLMAEMPKYFQKIQVFLLAIFENNASVTKAIDLLEIDWKLLLQNIISILGGGVSSTLDTFLNVLGTVVGSLFNWVLILVFSIYILLDKERFIRMYERLTTLYMKSEKKRKLDMVLKVIHQTFSSFIRGQCIEAVILGTLCATGMFILRMPYPVMIGTLVGAINIIPIIGAYIGGAIGAVLVFTVNPPLAIGFLIYLVLLQQFESNVIYPKVVGSSVGLPGIYVLGSVMVFGALAGIPGMFFGIPTVASIYKLTNMYLANKEKKSAGTSLNSVLEEKIDPTIGK